MQIRIQGKFDELLLTKKERNELWWLKNGLVFVSYLEEDIFLEDVFILTEGTEITLKEIKLQFDTKEPLTIMGKGWKCLCKFQNLDLNKLMPVKDWGNSENNLIAVRKNS